MIGDVCKYRGFLLVSSLILFMSFAFNVFGAMATDSFILNYKDSESLVVNQVRCGGLFNNQMLEVKSQYVLKDSKTCDKDKISAYSSQFGLQGKIYSIGYGLLSKIGRISVNKYIVIAQLTTAIFSAFTLGLLLLWIRSNFGFSTAFISTVLISISPMIVGFARNLYWALPLFILPLVFVLYFYRPNISRKFMLFFCGVLGLLLYLRYLCGYEYITTITIMLFSAMTYHLFISKAKIKQYLVQFSIIGLVSVLSFGLAVVTHVISLNSSTSSTSKSINVIMQRARERTVNPNEYYKFTYLNLNVLANDYYKTTDTYIGYESKLNSGSKFWSVFAWFSNYMLLPVYHLPIAFTAPFSLYVQSFIAFVLMLILIYVNLNKWVDKKDLRKVKALYFSSVIGLVGFFSWLILAFSHSLVHAHINGILIYLPFALFGYIIIGLCLDSIIKMFIVSRNEK